MPVILLVQMFAGDETKDDTDFFFCTTSCALCCPPLSPLFVQVSYRHVTADLRQWYKPTLCLHSRHGTMTRLLSHMWSDRGVEKARTFVFSTAAECHFGRAITASLMCVSASLISTPPLCFSYTTSRSHKGMRGRNKREESKQASDGAEREREEWRSRTKMWRWRGNEVEYKDVEPPNRAGAAERTCFVCCAECMHVCVYGWSCIQFMCVGVCVQQTQLWLALQPITRHSQLLITQHLFCPHSTLFCAHYQPGSLRRIRRESFV